MTDEIIITSSCSDLERNRVFKCYYCDKNCSYEFFDNETKESFVKYKEDLFLIRNPFSQDNCAVPYLAIGGVCCECKKQFCLEKCSLFLNQKRHCLNCATKLGL